MTDTTKKVRGASYPIVDIEKSISLSEQLLAAIGKAAASKEDVARALGYSGVNGKSKRIIAALIQYGLITGRASEHKLTSLALQILFPANDEARIEAIHHAAIKPSLFKALIDKYDGDMVPGLLSNILITSHGINPSSGEEAANVFKRTIEYAGLLDSTGKINIEGTTNATAENYDTAEQAKSAPLAHDVRDVNQGDNHITPQNQVVDVGKELNKIEIIIRQGVKAGIYAPADLTEAEKSKLKSIIDLL